MNLMRLRSSEHLRNLTATTQFTRAQLIQPLFVVEGLNESQPINGLPGVFRQNAAEGLRQIQNDLEKGVSQFLLFYVPQKKTPSNFQHQAAQQFISDAKKEYGSKINLWVDTCLCSSTDTGHCCVFKNNQKIDLEASLSELATMAKAYAEAGCDGVSPSDMMDSRTRHIRKALDDSGFENTPIMSYSTKFASNFYGPFREAASSAPQFGDRKQYQIDVRNRDDALAASVRCADEGADLLMVKPGLTSLDLITPIHEATKKPVGAYQVSGEFAGLHFLSEQKLLDFEKALLESWHVFKRAGSQYIITYGARLARSLGI